MQQLLACILLLASAFARKLSQAPAQSPSSDLPYTEELLTALNGNASESGPILYKTFEAAYYSILAEEGGGDVQLANSSRFVEFGNGSTALVAWAGNTLVLAFAASQADNDSLSQSVTTLSPVEFLSEVFNGNPPSANPAALDPFNSLISNITASGGAISTVTDGASNTSVSRVLCTGVGAWAQLCGPWAQITYPAANIRVISFGGQRVGDANFDWALQQLVDLPYLWLTQEDNQTVGQLPSGGGLVTPNITRVIPQSQYSGQGRNSSIQYYATLLNNTLKANNSAIPITLQTNYSYGYLPSGLDSQFVASSAPEGGGFVSKVTNVVGTVGDTISAAGSALGNAIGNIFGGDAPAPAPSASYDLGQLAASSPSSGDPRYTAGGGSSANASDSPGTCTPILCKLKPAIAAACAAYNDGAALGPGSLTVTADNTSTNVALAWNGDTKVATFAWRGTSGNEDWRQNLKLRFAEDTSSMYFDELYTGSQVYSGELESFQAVTEFAANDSVNIKAQMDMLSEGAIPNRIDCIGHSLGAGLATICGPWAAETWPASDVRVVNFGSPKAGNQEFASSIYASVGRIYRVVNSNDAVPSLPPFRAYLHANYALWLNDDQLLLEERSPAEISDLTWDKHGCDDQYAANLQSITSLTIPQLFSAQSL